MTGSSASPSVRIAADIRERIVAGEYVTGSRVPSTREITRTWGVAMATASRVLGMLRDEGLVQTVPGVGTVVAEPPTRGRSGSRRTAGGEAARDRIVATAITIADAEGLAGLSMRRVAAELGVSTMSLYRHVQDKEDLLTQMLDAVFRASPLPSTPPAGWRRRLELAGRMLWRSCRDHPWLAPALSVTRPQPIAGGMAYTEWVLAALDGTGLSLDARFTTHLVLFNYARGTAVNVESEAEAEASSGLSSQEWMMSQVPALQAVLAGGSLPTFARIIESEYDLDLDALFEFGLECLLDGVAARIARTATPSNRNAVSARPERQV
jgi:AcrR family transcriptional regulator